MLGPAATRGAVACECCRASHSLSLRHQRGQAEWGQAPEVWVQRGQLQRSVWTAHTWCTGLATKADILLPHPVPGEDNADDWEPTTGQDLLPL